MGHEAKQFYSLARAHEDIWLGPVDAQVALLYGMDSIFSWNAQPQSTAFNFQDEALRMYYPFWRNGAAVDVISIDRVTVRFQTSAALLAKYKIILLPAPIIVPDTFVDILDGYVQLGGVVWIGFRADLKNANNAMRRSPSRLAKLAGISIDEIESLNNPLSVEVRSADGKQNASAAVWRDGLRLLANSSAKVLWKYTDNFFGSLGLAAVTKRTSDNGGEAIYLGAGIDKEALVPLASDALKDHHVPHVGVSGSSQVEQLLRTAASGKRWRITINYGDNETTANGKRLGPYGIDIQEHRRQTSI